MQEISSELAKTYQRTPGGGQKGSAESLLSKFGVAMDTLQSNSKAFHDYLVDEMVQGNYFQIAPVNAVIRAGEAVDKVFFALSQLVISVPQEAKTEILDGPNRQRILEARNSQKKICALVSKHATDTQLQKVFIRVEETCQNFPESYVAVPKPPQPTQVLQDTRQPQ